MIKEFITEDNIIVPVVTRKQMIEVDRIAVEITGPNLFQMMENAGRNLAELTMQKLGDNWDAKNIIVLAGSGGNGGGGICAARHLANHGGNVKLCLSESTKLKEAPQVQLNILRNTSSKIVDLIELENEKPDLIIDALIGYSLVGEPRGKNLELIKWSNKQSCLKISLDVPSGIDSTTGGHSGKYFKPDITLTLALPKTGLLKELTGKLFLGDIGIPIKAYEILGIKNLISIFRKRYIIPIVPKNKMPVDILEK